MKTLSRIFVMLIFIAGSFKTFAQSTLEKYFYYRGVSTLSQAAHASNNYLSGTYEINNDCVNITIKSKDNVFGATINTNLKVIKGFGDLYFSDIVVEVDNDIVRPFEAFGLQISICAAIINAVDSDTYNKMRQSIIQYFNTDIKNWTGKMWAILALNLDYYAYALNN